MRGGYGVRGRGRVVATVVEQTTAEGEKMGRREWREELTSTAGQRRTPLFSTVRLVIEVYVCIIVSHNRITTCL